MKKGTHYLHDLARTNPRINPSERFAILEARSPDKTMILRGPLAMCECAKKYLSKVWSKSKEAI